MMAARGPYELKKRAESRDQTRARLVAAAADLHGEVGPAFTTMADVAERAGVSKMTAYRHFPSDSDLFRACSRHFIDANPLPDPEPWRTIADPIERLRHGLTQVYAYYRRHELRMANVLRDSLTMPVGGVFRQAASAWRTVLLDAWPSGLRESPVLTAAIALGVRFETWHYLVEREGLSDQGVIGYVATAAKAASAQH